MYAIAPRFMLPYTNTFIISEIKVNLDKVFRNPGNIIYSYGSLTILAEHIYNTL